MSYRFNLSTKLLLGFLAVIIAVVAFGYWNYQIKTNIKNVSERVYNHPLEVSKATRDIKFLMVAINGELNKLLNDTENNLPSEFEQKYSDLLYEIKAKLNILEDKYLGKSVTISKLKRSYNNWEHIFDSILREEKNGGELSYINQLRSELGIARKSVFEDLDIIIKFAEFKADELLTEINNEAINKGRQHFIFSSIVMILIFSILYNRLLNLIKPLNYLKKDIENFLKGTEKNSFILRSDDELDTLSGNQHKMIIKTSEEINKLEEKVGNQTLKLQDEIKKNQINSEQLDASVTRLNLASRIANIGFWERDLIEDKVKLDSKMFELFNIDRDKFTGNFSDWMEAIDNENREEVEMQLNLKDDLDASFKFSTEIILRKGEVKFIEIVGQVLKNDFGMPEKMIGVTRDITDKVKTRERVIRDQAILEAEVGKRTKDLKKHWEALAFLMEDSNQINSDLTKANEEKDRINKELEAFSYSVSHDLRAPLRGIDGYSQAILEDFSNVLDEEAIHYLHRIRLAAQKMSSLIDNMLKLSRISKKNLNIDLINMTEICHEIIEGLQEDNPERKIQFKIDAGMLVEGDKELVKILLNNLIGNAWKYSAKKDLTKISIELQSESFKEKNLDKTASIVSISDNGVGFNMRFKEKLFAPFQRLHSDIFFQGNGVGLAICQRIINRHGGTIWAESEIGVGSTFYFKLIN